jgi:flagellar hook-associated protein 1 FlgK
MSNILAGMMTSAGALNAFDQALQVSQNNVTNAQTPGYAKQTQTLDAVAFDPSMGSLGGVQAGVVQSSRDEYAEQAVRQQTVSLGAAQQNVSSLTSLQSLFDISGSSGIPSALNTLFQSFSAWGQTPTDTTVRQSVIDNASSLATTFNRAATGLADLAQTTEHQISQTVSQINQLAGQLQSDNQQIMQGRQSDAGLDAQVHSTLEQLSQYVNVTASKQADGTQTVLINGQIPLVIEDKQYNLGYTLAQPAVPPPVNANGPPHAQITDSSGTDITSQVTNGQLGALLNVRNTVLPTYMGDAYQTGDLNTMAQGFADRINQQLTSGNITDGPPVQQGVPLFTYDAANNTNIAQSLAVDPSVTPSQLAAIAPGPPEVSNGIPLALSQLANPSLAADQISGGSYTAFYAGMASRVGSALSDATGQQTVQQSALAQAQNLRQQSSGVNLDQEAATLVEFQRAYEANSRVMTILNTLAQDTLNILGTAG